MVEDPTKTLREYVAIRNDEDEPVGILMLARAALESSATDLLVYVEGLENALREIEKGPQPYVVTPPIPICEIVQWVHCGTSGCRCFRCIARAALRPAPPPEGGKP